MYLRGLFLGVVLGYTLYAQDSPEEYFENKVRPILVTRCYSCHAEVRASGLRVDSREGLIKGGNRGSAIAVGAPQKSLLLTALKHTDEKLRMPPQGKIPEGEIATIERWISAGAVWPSTTRATLGKAKILTQADKDFWSFRPLHKPEGTIDSLVRSMLARKGLRPNPPAAKQILLRRLSFDLTGLPPTSQQAAEFLSDTSPKAYERLLDSLLRSPHFGERWGRYWLDVARFGEEDFTGTEPRLYVNAWRYRDWVIQALNEDLPYDRFVKAQIAADLIKGDNAKLLPALGLFGLGPWYYSISQPQQGRADEINDRVDMVTRGFLGITGACARCHDHKYDPITMQDYYGLAGVFASSKYKEYPLASEREVERYKAAEANIKAQQKAIDIFLVTQSDQLADILSHRIADAMLASAGGRSAAETELDAEFLERFRKYLEKPEEEFPYLEQWYAAVRSKRPESELRELASAFQRLVRDVAAEKKKIDEENAVVLANARAKQAKGRKVILPFGYDSEADFNPGADVPVRSLDRARALLWRRFYSGKSALLRFEDTKVERFLEGAWKQHIVRLRAELDALKKQAPEPYPFIQGLAEHEEPMNAPIKVRGNAFQDGEPVPRRFLAVLSGSEPKEFRDDSGRMELAEAIVRSPLSARVMANRVWMHLIGAGVVRTPSNFGRSGERPSNPDLLEYLGSRFVELNGSVKGLIREIVLTETYRASSAGDPDNDRIDPANNLFWRANRRRLDAEALRDAILAASGSLDARIGGPSLPFDEKMNRRTVYTRISRFRQEETLALFDFPSASVSAEKRIATNVPLQKLFFLNSPFMLNQSATLADRVRSMGDNDRTRIGAAYELLYCRAPDAEEIRLGSDYLERAGPAAWPRYAQILLSSNEFAFTE